MLYITTRNNKDAYTAHRALHENAAPDGGVYVPFQMPLFSAQEIAYFASIGFSKTVAEILNKFFSCGLSGWDVDFCIGRNAVRFESMTRRIIVAELWHNPQGLYEHMCSALYEKITEQRSDSISDWFTIAFHIAILFGLYSELCRTNAIVPSDAIDLSTMADNLSLPLAALYAKRMGLPIGTIIFTCEENSGIWDLVHLGELSPAVANSNILGFERLIHTLLGHAAIADMHNSVNAKRTFRISEEIFPEFNNGLFCAVTGKDRCAQNVNSIYRSNSYILDPQAALSVGGLQDFRAKTGESKQTLVLSCVSPIKCVAQIAEATGISQEKLAVLMKNL